MGSHWLSSSICDDLHAIGDLNAEVCVWHAGADVVQHEDTATFVDSDAVAAVRGEVSVDDVRLDPVEDEAVTRAVFHQRELDVDVRRCRAIGTEARLVGHDLDRIATVEDEIAQGQDGWSREREPARSGVEQRLSGERAAGERGEVEDVAVDRSVGVRERNRPRRHHDEGRVQLAQLRDAAAVSIGEQTVETDVGDDPDTREPDAVDVVRTDRTEEGVRVAAVQACAWLDELDRERRSVVLCDQDRRRAQDFGDDGVEARVSGVDYLLTFEVRGRPRGARRHEIDRLELRERIGRHRRHVARVDDRVRERDRRDGLRHREDLHRRLEDRERVRTGDPVDRRRRLVDSGRLPRRQREVRRQRLIDARDVDPEDLPRGDEEWHARDRALERAKRSRGRSVAVRVRSGGANEDRVERAAAT